MQLNSPENMFFAYTFILRQICIQIYQTLYNIKVRGTCIQTNMCIARDFKENLQYEPFHENLGIREPHRVMWICFHCAQGVFSNYAERNLITLFPDTYSWMTITYTVETNAYRQIFALKSFSTENLSLSISQEISPFLNWLELCPYPFSALQEYEYANVFSPGTRS